MVIIPDRLRRPVEVERDKLRKALADARAEIERFNNLFKNGIECFMSPCVAHSGENTPPFDQFMEKYGRKCTPCLVSEIERKDALIEQMREALRLLSEAVRALDEQISTVHDKIVITDAVSLLRLQNDVLSAVRQAEVAIAAAKGEV